VDFVCFTRWWKRRWFGNGDANCSSLKCFAAAAAHRRSQAGDAGGELTSGRGGGMAAVEGGGQ
jgi:hypothetical protein